MVATIDRFINEFAFLSNFHPSTIVVEGRQYATIEHAYQAFKTLDPQVRETIRKARSPGVAKRLGRCVQLRRGWNEMRVDIMRMLVREKFKNPFLREMLLATGTATLVEGNHWNDTYFGVCRGVGKNWLGRILMEIRAEIHQEDAVQTSDVDDTMEV